MDANHQNRSNSNLVPTEIKLWLPSSYTDHKAPEAPAPKKKYMSRKFIGTTGYERFMLILAFFAALGAIAIPFVVTIIGLNVTQQITQQQTNISQKQHQTDAQIALDQQRETTLQTYVSNMQDLILNYHLRTSKPNDEVREIARARTLFALRQLDGIRKGYLIDFIYQAHLIQAPKSSSDNLNPIVSLTDADLSGMVLFNPYLHTPGNVIAFGCSPSVGVSNFEYLKLDGADFDRADLSGSSIRCMSMEGASLFGANLNGAFLESVDLSKGNLGGIDLSCLYSSITGYCAHTRFVLFDYADLDYANLEGTDLTHCFFANTNLNHASLSYANLTDAYLIGANLNDAVLLHAKITSQGLESASSLHRTIMPDGSEHP